MDSREAVKKLTELGFKVVKTLKESSDRVSLLAWRGGNRVVVKIGWGIWRSLVENEARILSLLGDSPIAPRLYEIIELGDAIAVVEEAIGYRSLDALPKPLPFTTAISMLFHILVSLAQIHGLGLAHCDVKPSNLIPVPRRGIVIIDFDLARRFGEQGPPGGTRGYTCPEVLTSGVPGPGCDLYSIPAIYYNLTTGREPPPDPSSLSNALQLAPGPSSLIELLVELALNPSRRNSLDPLTVARMIARYHPRLLTPHLVIDDRYYVLPPAGLRIGDPPVLEVKPQNRGVELHAYAEVILYRRGRRLPLKAGESTRLEYGDILVAGRHIIRVFIP